MIDKKIVDQYNNIIKNIKEQALKTLQWYNDNIEDRERQKQQEKKEYERLKEKYGKN